MITVYEAASIADAHLIKSLLVQEGIGAHVRGEYLQGGLGEIPVSGMIGVSVADADGPRARAIVLDWQQGTFESPDSAGRNGGVGPEVTAPPTSRPRSGLRIVAAFAIGAIAGGGTVWSSLRGPVAADGGIDYNGDGFADERAYYSGETVVRVEIDRNRDRKPDSIIHHDRRGIVSHIEDDDDFDGHAETVHRYRHGLWIATEVDSNGDGAPEYRNEAIAGVIYKEEWLDASGRVIKHLVYRRGWPFSSDIDADGDGRLETRRHYDWRGEIVRSAPVEPGITD